MGVVPRTLRARVLLLLFVAFLVSAAAFTWAMSRVVSQGYQHVESAGVARDVDRASAAVHQMTAKLDSQVAAWDSGASAAGGAGAVAALSLGDLQTLDADFAVQFNVSGVPLTVLARDRASGRPTTLAPETLAVLGAVTTRIDGGEPHGAVSGIMRLPTAPAILSARIPGSRGGAENRGPLVVGRYLLPTEADEIGAVTKLEVVLGDPARAAALTPQQAPPPAVGSSWERVAPVDQGTIAGWEILKGIDERPALLVLVREPRIGAEQANTTLAYARLGVSLLAVIVGLSIVVMLEGSVSSRIRKLRKSVVHYGVDDDPAPPPVTTGSDEIADLAVALHETLGSIKASEQAHRQLAHHDHLTKLSNRRYFEETAPQMLAECAAAEKPCTLVLLDLDDFKVINDELGHQVGDEVLVWFGRLMGECLPDDSIRCRLGGDEFAVLMPRADHQTAETAVEHLRGVTTAGDESLGYGMVHVRFSVGYAIFPDHGDNLEMLTQCADTDLYANKRAKDPL